MASNKKEEGNPSFIQQTEQYSIENDMDRRSRDSQLQSKGFREELHNPQPSPYVHATERMSAIDTDTTAIHTLGRGIEAGLHLYEKYDQGPSIQQYVDDVTEITKAHEQGRIDDEVYRREMRRARNAAQNAYANDPRAMAKLKDFENGGMYGEFKQYEASMWKVSQKYTEITGIAAAPYDENFYTVQLPKVQELADSGLKLQLARNEQFTLAANDNIDYEKLKPKIAELSSQLSDYLTKRYTSKLESGGSITEDDIQELEDYSLTLMQEYQSKMARHLDKPLVRAQYEMFKTAFRRISSLRNITDHAQMMREFQEIQAGLNIESTKQQMQIRGDKAAKVAETAINNAIQHYKDNGEKYPYTLLGPAAFAYSGDKKATQELVNKGRKGDSEAAFHGLNAGLNFEEDPDTAFSTITGTPITSYYQIKEERGYEDQLRLKTRTSEVWNEAKIQFEEFGKRTSMFNGKETPLSKQLRFKGFTSDGVNIQPLPGASEEAKNLARSVNNMLTKVLITRSYCTQNHCDFKKLSKNPKVKVYMMELLRGIANG